MRPATRFIRRPDADLAVYRWGPRSDRPVVLLVHGYPDNAQVWAPVAEHLAQQYTVIAYDVRGAGRSSRPRGTAAYRMQTLMQDQLAVIEAMSPQRPVHLVGHDWGALQSWETVTEPGAWPRIASYTALSGPCLDHMGHWIRKRLRRPAGISQILRQAALSWYIGMFQLPPPMAPVWRLAGDRGWFALQQRLEGVRPALRSPVQPLDGRFGIELYRANMLPLVLRPRQRRSEVPVQVLIPQREPFMLDAVWDDLEQWVPNLSRYRIAGGHWALLSHPQLVADAIAQHVQQHLAPSRLASLA